MSARAGAVAHVLKQQAEPGENGRRVGILA
jgi:hypothetical protein